MGKKSLKGKRVRLAVCFIVSITIIVGICFDFVYQMEQNSVTLIEESMIKNAQSKSKNISYLIEDNFTILETLAMAVVTYDDVFDLELHDFLTEAGLKRMDSGIGVADDKGNGFLLGGEVFSVADRDYYQKAMKGERVISEILTSRADGKKSIAFAVPIFKEGNIAGVLWNVFREEQLGALLRAADTENYEYPYILDFEGNIIASHAEELGSKVIDEAMDFDINYMEQLKFNVKKGNGGVFKSSKGKERLYCTYEPVPETNWCYFSINYSEKSVEFSRQALADGILFMGKMVLIICLMTALVIAYTIRKNREMKAVTDILENVSRQAPGGMFSFCPGNYQFYFVSDGLLKLLECNRAQFQERYENNFINIICPADWDRLDETIGKHLEDKDSWEMRYRLVTYTGRTYWVQQVSNCLVEGADINVYGVLVDISESKRFESELLLSNQRYKIIANQMEAVLIEYNIESGEMYISENFEEMFGRKLEGALNYRLRSDSKYVHEEDLKATAFHFNRMLQGSEYEEVESRMRKGDGTYIWCLVRYYALSDVDGKANRFVCKISNIDKLRRRTEDLVNKAQKDPLTLLYNKAVSKELIEKHLSDKPDTLQVFIVIDIDDFKKVNDTYGHMQGDKTLLNVARTLQGIFRKSDVIGRIGGDEFLVFMKDCASREYAVKKVTDLAITLKTQAEKEGITITCSIGAALYQEHGSSYQELFQKADLALYQAKEKGKNQSALYEDIENQL